MKECYFKELTQLGMRMLQLLALSLKLPRDFFNHKFENPILALRLLRYEPIVRRIYVFVLPYLPVLRQ